MLSDYELKKIVCNVINNCPDEYKTNKRICKINPDCIDLKTNRMEIVEARQLCHYFALKIQKRTSSEIGESFGKKDHATVLHSKKTILNLKDCDKRTSYLVNKIEEEINNPRGWIINKIKESFNFDILPDKSAIIEINLIKKNSTITIISGGRESFIRECNEFVNDYFKNNNHE
jgi:hypothetical protein